MARSIEMLFEQSLYIALDYLERTGEVKDSSAAYEYLGRYVANLIEHGERSQLMLSNRAIGSYQKYHATKSRLHLVG